MRFEGYISAGPLEFRFHGRFSCKSRSQANNKASQNINCIQRQDTSTESSYTWEAVYAYIAKALPIVIVLENVAGLMAKLGAEPMSDAEYICERFRALGYYTIIYKFDAECFGSRASRLRIYFIGWLVVPGDSLVPGPIMDIVKTRYSWLENFIHS